MWDGQVVWTAVLMLEKRTDVVMGMPREDKEEGPGGLDCQEVIREQTTCARFEYGMRKKRRDRRPNSVLAPYW